MNGGGNRSNQSLRRQPRGGNNPVWPHRKPANVCLPPLLSAPLPECPRGTSSPPHQYRFTLPIDKPMQAGRQTAEQPET
jgi:hypothetical protein